MYSAGVFLCGTLSEGYDAIDNLPHVSHSPTSFNDDNILKVKNNSA